MMESAFASDLPVTCQEMEVFRMIQEGLDALDRVLFGHQY